MLTNVSCVKWLIEVLRNSKIKNSLNLTLGLILVKKFWWWNNLDNDNLLSTLKEHS
jgi:hypothetical protein